jgi:hypothetical protein
LAIQVQALQFQTQMGSSAPDAEHLVFAWSIGNRFVIIRWNMIDPK